MKIDREGWSDIGSAIAAPARNLGAFLRAGLLPYLLSLAAVCAVALNATLYADRSVNAESSAPPLVSALVCVLIGVALLSLVSFTINWRRSLVRPEGGDAPISLLSLDGRSLAYIVAKFRGDGSAEAPTGKAPKESRNWLKGVLGLMALLAVVALVLTAIAIGLFAVLIVFRPEQDTINTVLAALLSWFFVSQAFGPQRWRACAGIALDIAPDDLPATSRGPSSFPLSILVWLMFLSLALFVPVSMDRSPVETLLPASAWIGALFLAIGWFAALETKTLARDLGRPGAGKLHVEEGRGHRQFRARPPHQPI